MRGILSIVIMLGAFGIRGSRPSKLCSIV